MAIHRRGSAAEQGAAGVTALYSTSATRQHGRYLCNRSLVKIAGVTARQRKDELERLNEQLRKINTSLRKQARAGTLYAPGLTYIPPGAHLRPPHY